MRSPATSPKSKVRQKAQSKLRTGPTIKGGSTTRRPYTNRDIHEFMAKYGFTVRQTCELLGINRMNFGKFSNEDEIIKDPSIEILLRLYDTFPTVLLKSGEPNMVEVFNTIRESEPSVLGADWQFSVLFGRNMSQSYNWMRDGAPSPSVARLVKLMGELKAAGHKGVYKTLRTLAEKTARARGVSPFSTGRWT